MCFDVACEVCGLRFSTIEEPPAELPHTRHGVSDPSLCLEDLAQLSIR